MTEVSRAPGEPTTATKRLLSSVIVYRWAFSSHPGFPVISPAGHMSFSRGRNEPVMVIGSVLSTSRSMTMAGSSRGANITCRTVKAG